MKRVCPPTVEWRPHSICFNDDCRIDPFYWLRGPSKRSIGKGECEGQQYFLTSDEYVAKGIERSVETCFKPQKEIKSLLKQENLYTQSFLPWTITSSADIIEKSYERCGSGTQTTPSMLTDISVPAEPVVFMSQKPTKVKPMTSKKVKKSSKLETPTHYLFRELKRRVQKNEASIPHKDEQYWYFNRSVEKEEYLVHCRLPLNSHNQDLLKKFAMAHQNDPQVASVAYDESCEEVLFDVNLFAEEHSLKFVETDQMDESPSKNLLCVGVDMSDGKEIFSIFVFDISALDELPVDKSVTDYKKLRKNPPIVRKIDMLDCCGECVFLSDHILAFSVMDEQQRSHQVILHDLRLPADDDGNDVVLFEEDDPRYSVGSLSVSEVDCKTRYFHFSTSSSDGSEIYRLKLPSSSTNSSTISDLVKDCECLFPRPTENERSEITAHWHPNIDGEGSEGWFFVHNQDSFDDFTISYLKESDLKKDPKERFSNLKHLIQTTPCTVIESLEVQSSFLLVSIREKGFSNCYIFDIKTVQSVISQQSANQQKLLSFENGVSLSEWIGVRSSPKSSSNFFSVEASVSTFNTIRASTIRLSVHHFIRPTEIWEVNVGSVFQEEDSDSSALKVYVESIPGIEYDPELYEVAIVTAPATTHAQGSQVPASGIVDIPIVLCYRRDMFKEKSAPLLLDVYGSYGDCTEAEFSRNRLSLLDRGVVYAIGWVRGGGEMGRAWRDNGRLHLRNNSITDVSACAAYLIEAGWTHPSKLVVRGGSAGGSLVCGAMMNTPELFYAVLAGVPFVDCLTSMLDPSIPLTTIEWEEWGNPVTSAQAYFDIKGYSPMDNVPGFDLLCHDTEKMSSSLNSKFLDSSDKGQNWEIVVRKLNAFPHVYIDSSFGDSRVAYWEPMALVTRLRAVMAAMKKKFPSFTPPLILHYCQMDAGHTGASGRFTYLKETAREYAFLLKVWQLPVIIDHRGSDNDTESDVSGTDDAE